MIEDVIAETFGAARGARAARSADDIRRRGHAGRCFLGRHGRADRAIKAMLAREVYRHQRVMDGRWARPRAWSAACSTRYLPIPARCRRTGGPSRQATTTGSARRVADFLAGMTDRYARRRTPAGLFDDARREFGLGRAAICHEAGDSPRAMNIFHDFTDRIRAVVQPIRRRRRSFGGACAIFDRIVVEPPRDAAHGDLAIQRGDGAGQAARRSSRAILPPASPRRSPATPTSTRRRSPGRASSTSACSRPSGSRR